MSEHEWRIAFQLMEEKKRFKPSKLPLRKSLMYLLGRTGSSAAGIEKEKPEWSQLEIGG
jgi:hypothetical protein